MNEDVKLEDPIKWVIKAKSDLENVDIHFTNKEWVKLLKTYIEETFETYRTKISNDDQQPQYKQFGFSMIDVQEDED